MTTALTPENVFMDRFALEPKVQRVWRVPHATWFTLMGIGGAVFLLARGLGLLGTLGVFLGLPLADLVSFGAIAVGGLILIADLGRPFRVWRAFTHWRTSWITWGAISDAIFLVCGGLLILPGLVIGDSAPLAGLPWTAEASSAVGRALEILAGAAAVVVVFYAGAVLAAPRSIPYWHSPAIPLQFVASSAAMAMGVILALAAANDEPITGGQMGLLALFTGALLVLIGWHLSTRRTAPGKSHSIQALVQGRLRATFLGGVVLLGTSLPLVLGIVGAAVESLRAPFAVLAAVLLVAGGFLLRLCTLRAGVFPPVKLLTKDGEVSAVSR